MFSAAEGESIFSEVKGFVFSAVSSFRGLIFLPAEGGLIFLPAEGGLIFFSG